MGSLQEIFIRRSFLEKDVYLFFNDTFLVVSVCHKMKAGLFDFWPGISLTHINTLGYYMKVLVSYDAMLCVLRQFIIDINNIKRIIHLWFL